MSQEESVVRGQFDAATRRDFAAAPDAFDKDVVLAVAADAIPTGAWTLRGREAVGEWFAEWFSSFADCRFKVEEMRSVGEKVFAVASHKAHGRASGVELDWSLAYLYTARSYEIVRMEIANWAVDAYSRHDVDTRACSCRRGRSVRRRRSTGLVRSANRARGS
jgi:ketosteroid isomerase-like protein